MSHQMEYMLIDPDLPGRQLLNNNEDADSPAYLIQGRQNQGQYVTDTYPTNDLLSEDRAN